MLRKFIRHLRTIFYVSDQRMMVSEGQYKQYLILVCFWVECSCVYIYIYIGYKRKQYPITMMNDTAFVIYGFVNSLISKWLFFQCV